MTKQRWSEDEKKILQEHYRDINTRRLAEALPSRTPGAIHDMAGRLGLRKSEERLKEMGMRLVEGKKQKT